MTKQKLFDTAVDWWVLLDQDDCPAHVRQAFERWRDEDPRHAQAFADVCAIWGELREVSREIATHDHSQEAQLKSKPSLNRRALLLVAAFSAVAVWFMDPLLYLQADYITGPGQVQQIALADGSIVQLDGGSALAINNYSTARELQLLKGEAWFEVRTDNVRPFRVHTGSHTVTALGTVFDVLMNSDQAQITAIEHRINVRSNAKTDSGITLDPGQQLDVDNNASGPSGSTHKVDAHAIGAWRAGKLIFQDCPLGEVISRLNRHYLGYIVLTDRTLSSRRVSGVFYTQQPLAALAGIESSLKLKSTRLTDYLILLHH